MNNDALVCGKCKHLSGKHRPDGCGITGCKCAVFSREPVPHAKSVIVFPNANVAVFGDDAQQIPEIQGSWINYSYLKKLAKAIARDGPEVEGAAFLPIAVGDLLRIYIKHYKKNPEAEA